TSSSPPSSNLARLEKYFVMLFKVFSPALVGPAGWLITPTRVGGVQPEWRGVQPEWRGRRVEESSQALVLGHQ
ncbi:hypothetical protein A2U01_0102858, partial [Trifolium medium]|nr:hypothetical protein [Trifolium medium]